MGRIPVVNEAEHNASILIAARPCRVRDSLYLLLKTMPGIEVIGRADGCLDGVGWQFGAWDDQGLPSIELCPGTCTAVQEDPSGSLRLLLGCAI